MERLLYIDCFSGVSGDMLLGAFLGLGFPEALLVQTLKPLGLGKTFDLTVDTTSRHGIGAIKVSFPELEPAGRSAVHTHFGTIRRFIEAASLDEAVKKRGLDIFRQLAMAESAVHQVDVEAVHFHEAGGIDSIADIMGIAAALHWCEADRVVAPAVPLGTGFVHCQHGELPVPVPAVVELLCGVPVVHTGIPAELVTPTGAAVLKTVVDAFYPRGYADPWVIEATGYGAGSRDLAERPNLLRLQLGHGMADENATVGRWLLEKICLLETAIDDMTPEQVAALQEGLLAAGAVDVIIHQVLMKKNRPGMVLQVLVPLAREGEIVDHFFKHSRTLGLRRSEVSRYLLERKTEIIETPWGSVRIKIARSRQGDVLNVKPEYDDLLSLARKEDLSLVRMEQLVVNHCQRVYHHGDDGDWSASRGETEKS